MYIHTTKHLGKRLRERKLSIAEVIETVRHPTSFSREKQNSTRFNKQFSGYTITAVTVEPKKGEKLIISAWRNPPASGTRDEKKNRIYSLYRSSRGFKKLMLGIRLALMK